MAVEELLATDVVCRKSHRCIWCGETISVGDIVPFRKYVYDGEMCNDHYHPECLDAMNEDDIGDEGFMPYEAERGSVEAKNYGSTT